MMFDILSKDLISEIFSFDDTYRDLYHQVVKDAFENDEFRAIKFFLQDNPDFLENDPERMFKLADWQSIRHIMHNGMMYYQIHWSDYRTVLCVVPEKMKDEIYADYSDPYPRLYNMLFKGVIENKFHLKYNDDDIAYRFYYMNIHIHDDKLYIVMWYNLPYTK